MVKKVAKNILRDIDSRYGTSLYETAERLVATISSAVDALRRLCHPVIVRMRLRLLDKNKGQTKLHLGCGGKHLDGFINIDWRKTNATDFVFDIRKLPFPDRCVDKIETHHVIEHIPRNEIDEVLREWRRVLIDDGEMIIECPDFDEIVKEYLHGEEERIDGVFGLQRFKGDTHYFGYNFERLARILETNGFYRIVRREPQDEHAKDWPCIRVECRRGNTRPPEIGA